MGFEVWDLGDPDLDLGICGRRGVGEGVSGLRSVGREA